MDKPVKSHYVPQFIIKAFSEKPFVFNILTGETNPKRPKSFFYEKGFYSNEVEEVLNYKIEQPFSLLIPKKLLADKLQLTRDEIELTKQYMLVASIRTMGEAAFVQKMKEFASNVDRFRKLYRPASWEEALALNLKRSIADLGLTDRDLFTLALERFCEDRTYQELLFDPLLPIEMTIWALPFTVSYIAVWDASPNRQFLLTDCGMNSEYEGMRLLTRHDLSKFSYLYWLLKNGSPAECHFAAMNLAFSQSMYENIDFFPISKTRLIVAIHPFFKTFFPDSLVDQDGQPIFQSKPKCWPSCLENIGLFEPPSCQYVEPGTKSPKDVFNYTKKTLSDFETDYLNVLMLGSAREEIAFDSPKAILASAMAFFWDRIQTKVVASKLIDQDKVLASFEEEFGKSGYWPFIDVLLKAAPDDSNFLVAVEEVERITKHRLEDFNTNPYAADFILHSPDLLQDEKCFGFLGNMEKRTEILKAIADTLKVGKA